MKLFHIGIRTTEIVSIHPSDKDNLPTVYRLKNGFSSFTTGDWRENVRLVEKALLHELHGRTDDISSAIDNLAKFQQAGRKDMRLKELRSLAIVLEYLGRAEV